MKQQLEEYMTDNGCTGNCTKLKWNRLRLGLSQQEFAKKIGLTQPTISKLERDETAWATLQDDTVDKIMSFYESMASWQPERADKILREINEPVKSEDAANIVDEEPVDEVSKCEMLVACRRKIGMSQTELSVRTGVNEKIIRRLEKDESAWESVRESAVEKIMDFCSNTSSYQSEKLDTVCPKPQIKEEPELIEPRPITEKKPANKIDNLHKQDIKTLTLIEFAYEELTDAKTHDEFELAIKMIKKIVDKY